MRIRVASDLHCEFHPDGGSAVLDAVTAGEFDVLVLAGDIADAKRLHRVLAEVCVRSQRPVVYVHGNHEFYGSSRFAVVGATLSLTSAFPHLHWLDCGTVTIDGQRFVGAPLWYREPPPMAPKWAMNDAAQIEGFEGWVGSENQRALQFLEDEVTSSDVVVTHYLPHPRSVHRQYARSALNPFFLCDCTPLIERAAPRLWVHGHTHSSMRYRVGPTEVVCNPLGYVGTSDRNAVFEPELTVEVST